MESRNEIKRRIRVLCASQDRSIKDLSEAIGMSPMSLSNRMNGNTDWKMTELSRIAAVFECEVGFLLGTNDRSGCGINVETMSATVPDVCPA